MDEVGIVSKQQERRLDQLIRALQQAGGPQIAVNIIDGLGDEPIKQYSIRVVEAWQLGGAQKDNGLLLVIALKDRKMRIEVGNGIEGEITDLESYQAIKNILTPAFKEGQFAQGIGQFILWSAKEFQIDLAGNLSHSYRKKFRPVRYQAKGHNPALFPILLFAFIILYPLVAHFSKKNRFIRGLFGGTALGLFAFFVFSTALTSILLFIVIGFFTGLLGLGNTLILLAHSSGGRYRGGFGGGGFGGGGFSGGGGGFSGGGASGSW